MIDISDEGQRLILLIVLIIVAASFVRGPGDRGRTPDEQLFEYDIDRR